MFGVDSFVISGVVEVAVGAVFEVAVDFVLRLY